MTYIVRLSKPDKAGIIKVISSEINKTDSVKTVYDAVVFFEKNIFSNIKEDEYKNISVDRILLKDIINIHDNDGIKDMKQIESMRKAIISGKEVLSDNGIPNIQLVLTKEGKLLLFNGHHTMLAYMMEGKEYLEEIQHVIVSDKEEGFINDDEISVFFGEHRQRLISEDWRESVINWQAPKEKQLCKRKQNNMGELFKELSDRF